MPRTTKCRRVCHEPSASVFLPEQGATEWVELSVDELEAIRLCDLEGLDQDEAAERMNVSRGTFQRILYAARRQTAKALCAGKGLRISGGNYRLAEDCCKREARCSGCRFRQAGADDRCGGGCGKEISCEGGTGAAGLKG